MSRVQRLLVPIDFSAGAETALAYAVDVARRHGRILDLLHVVDDSDFAGASPEWADIDTATLRACQIDAATDHLELMAARCRAAGVWGSSEVDVGNVARVIAQTATSQGSDLIVMGIHGRGAFAHSLLGSVADCVMCTAPCPVLIVRDN